jgi:hypothetical protein
MLSSALRRILDDVARTERNGEHADRYSFALRDRTRVDTLLKGGFLERYGENHLAITRKGQDARCPPVKKPTSERWRPEPRGPGLAERRFANAEGERLELLAYTFLADDLNNRLCSGFEIFARDYRGRFYEQVAAGEAPSLAEAKRAAEEMIKRPRAEWRIEIRSWAGPS